MTRWLLTVGHHRSRQQYQSWYSVVLGEVTGTWEDAHRALWDWAVRYKPSDPWVVERRWILRDGNGFLSVFEGLTLTVTCKFRAREILWSEPAGKAPSPTPQEPPPYPPPCDEPPVAHGSSTGGPDGAPWLPP